MIEKFLTDNSTAMRLLRTIFQGVLAVIVTKLPDIFGLFHVDPASQAILVPILMAIFSPIMATMGRIDDTPTNKKE